jgi:hypothetical protein
MYALRVKQEENLLSKIAEVGHCLSQKAREIKSNIYQVKKSLLDDYLIQELRNPRVVFE